MGDHFFSGRFGDRPRELAAETDLRRPGMNSGLQQGTNQTRVFILVEIRARACISANQRVKISDEVQSSDLPGCSVKFFTQVV